MIEKEERSVSTETMFERTMDIHLLSRVEDDGSPFGVQYSTRRLRLEGSGEASCDASADALWQELAAGIRGKRPDETVLPTDGAAFLDTIPKYFRYHFLSPFTPLVYDRRGPTRPDNFRIEWTVTTDLTWGHGFQFLCELAARRRTRDGERLLPVAKIDGWGFYHEFRDITPDPAPPRPRLVTVGLLPPDSSNWGDTVLGSGTGVRDTQEFVRAFLRRFFERMNGGVELDLVPGDFRQGVFVWRGGF
jgi:hypothetical protein